MAVVVRSPDLSLSEIRRLAMHYLKKEIQRWAINLLPTYSGVNNCDYHTRWAKLGIKKAAFQNM